MYGKLPELVDDGVQTLTPLIGWKGPQLMHGCTMSWSGFATSVGGWSSEIVRGSSASGGKCIHASPLSETQEEAYACKTDSR